MKKAEKIFLNSLPILLMIFLIPIIKNDYFLSLVYIGIITFSLYIKKERNDGLVLVLGFFIMIISEWLFIRTGVEVFTRRTLLGVMPLWLPFLWSYCFVVIKRSVEVLNK